MEQYRSELISPPGVVGGGVDPPGVVGGRVDPAGGSSANKYFILEMHPPYGYERLKF